MNHYFKKSTVFSSLNSDIIRYLHKNQTETMATVSNILYMLHHITMTNTLYYNYIIAILLK